MRTYSHQTVLDLMLGHNNHNETIFHQDGTITAMFDLGEVKMTVTAKAYNKETWVEDGTYLKHDILDYTIEDN